MEFIIIKTEQNMKEILKIIYKKDMGNIIILVEQNIKEIGKMV